MFLSTSVNAEQCHDTTGMSCFNCSLVKCPTGSILAESKLIESTHQHPVWDLFLSQMGVSIKDATENQIILEPKKRGRPKKHNLPILERTTTHKLSDNELPIRALLKTTKVKVFQDYEEYVEEGLAPRDALNKVADLYKIPYLQAYNIVDNF